MISVSIIIVNYNSFDFTYKCLKSIIHKTKNVSYEVIVVDNASAEFDKRKIEEVSDSVTTVINKENFGFAKANNIGIQNSKGEVILLLNNDTVLLNDAISKCYQKIKEDNSIGTVGCKLLNEDHSWQKSFYEFPTLKSQAKKIFRIKGSPVNKDRVDFVPWLTGAFLMFRKSSLQFFEGKRLNEEFFMYCEDIQWGMQFKKNGFKALYYPEGEVVHFQGKSSSFNEDFNKKIKYYYPNLMKLLKMEHGWFYAKSFFIVLILTFLSDSKNNSFQNRILPLIKVLKTK